MVRRRTLSEQEASFKPTRQRLNHTVFCFQVKYTAKDVTASTMGLRVTAMDWEQEPLRAQRELRQPEESTSLEQNSGDGRILISIYSCFCFHYLREINEIS